MIKQLLFVAAVALVSVPASAQTKTTTTTKTKEGKKEIIIEEKANGKSEKMVIVVDGENITINGKPAKEYDGKKHIVIDDDVIIANGRAWSPSRLRTARAPMPATRVMTNRKPTAFLGVVTENTDGKGARVEEVVEKSAAEKAGLKKDDVITMIGTKKVTNPEELTAAIRDLKPEEAVDLTYTRAGSSKKVKATLGKSNTPMVWSANGENFNFNFDHDMAFDLPRVYGDVTWNGVGQGMLFGRPKYGMMVEDYADGNGVLVTGVDSASNAEKAGLRKDDIIVRLNKEDIKTLDNLRRELAELHDEGSFEVGVLRSGRQETLTMRVPKQIKSANL